MKHLRWLSLLFLGALAQNGLQASESISAAAGDAFPSLQDSGSARAIAMGSTYVGIAEGSATLPWNPAGLVGVCSPELSLHHNSTLMGSFQESAIFAMPLNADNGLGVSLNYGDSGSFEGRDAVGALVGDYSAHAYGASLGWGFRAPANLSFGLALKFNHQDLAGRGFDAFAGDLGALWTPNPRLSVGAAYTNLGPDVAGSHLAQGLSLGVSSYLWKGRDFEWLFSLSGEALTRSDSSIHFGLEHTLFRMLSLRAGYGVAFPQQESTDGLQGWTFGAGVKLGTLALDYAFVPMADLGNVQRISLSYAFGDCKASPTPTPSPSPSPSPTPAAKASPTPVAAVPAELVLQLTDADFRYTHVGENEALTLAAQDRLHAALAKVSGVKGAVLRISGKTKVKGEDEDIAKVGKKRADKAEFKEVGVRREKLVRAYVAKTMPAATLASLTSPDSEGTESDNMKAVFHLEVR
jgi:hypothetical protein